MTFENLSEEQSADINAPILVKLTGAEFQRSTEFVRVFLDEVEVSNPGISFTSATQLKINPLLREGKNRLDIWTLDRQNRLLNISGAFIGGKNEIKVRILNENGELIPDNEVLLRSNGYSNLKFLGENVNGEVIFKNVPDGFLYIEGASFGRYGSKFIFAYESQSIDLKLELVHPSFPQIASSARFSLSAAEENESIPLNISVSPNQIIRNAFRTYDNAGNFLKFSDFFVGYAQTWIQVPPFAKTITVKGRFNLPLEGESKPPICGGIFTLAAPFNSASKFEAINTPPDGNGISYVTLAIPKGATEVLLNAGICRYEEQSARSIVLESYSFTSTELKSIDLLTYEYQKLTHFSADPTNPYFEQRSLLGGSIRVECGANDWVTNLTLEVFQETNTSKQLIGIATITKEALPLLNKQIETPNPSFSITHSNLFGLHRNLKHPFLPDIGGQIATER